MARTIEVVLRELQEQAERTAAQGKNQGLWPSRLCERSPESAWAFIREIRTWNEAETEIQNFPDLEYLRYLTTLWVKHKEIGEPIIIEKCRRMVVSWLLRGLELWSMGISREDHVIVGLTREAAAKHVWRIKHFYDDLRTRNPSWGLEPIDKNVIREKGPRALASIQLPNQSQVVLLNQEGGSFPGEGYSVITCEELSRYDYVAETWAQCKIVSKASAGKVGGFVVAVTNAWPDQDWKDIKKCV